LLLVINKFIVTDYFTDFSVLNNQLNNYSYDRDITLFSNCSNTVELRHLYICECSTY